MFGSNLAGIHGAGSAKAAAKHHGAKRGVGSGPTGNAYAIPTKETWRDGPLPLGRIAIYVAAFLLYAEAHPELEFDVVRIGCGLAGYEDHQVAPLFAGAPDNVFLPFGWRRMHEEPPERAPVLAVESSRSSPDDSARTSSALSPSGAGDAPPPTAETLAQRFHEAYERLAPSFGYETRTASAKPWAEVPENNRRLMTAVCAEILATETAALTVARTARDRAEQSCERREGLLRHAHRVLLDKVDGDRVRCLLRDIADELKPEEGDRR